MATYNFSASVTSEGTIEIKTDTTWTCKSEGNFMLSEFYGSGDSSVNIIIPETVSVANGTVYFSYGNNSCPIKDIMVYQTNNCHIETVPDYEMCNGSKTILLPYKEPNELLNVSIKSFNEWNIETNDIEYIKYNGGYYIIAPDTDEQFSLISLKSEGCDDVIIKLYKVD